MQEHDARILRGAAIPTAAAGVIAMVIAWVMTGVPGIIGAVLGMLLVLGFFAASAYVIALTGEKRPALMLPMAFVVYTTKVGILAVVLILFRGTTAFDATAFACTALACVIAWLTGQAVGSMKVKQLYVEPVGSEAHTEEKQ